MAKLLLAKMASAAALVSTSVMLNGCWTIAGRPVICNFGYAMKDGRCAKVVKANAPRSQHFVQTGAVQAGARRFRF